MSPPQGRETHREHDQRSGGDVVEAAYKGRAGEWDPRQRHAAHVKILRVEETRDPGAEHVECRQSGRGPPLGRGHPDKGKISAQDAAQKTEYGRQMLQGKKTERLPGDEIETAGEILVVGRSPQRINRSVEGVIRLSDKHGEHPGPELRDGIGEQVVIPQRIAGADESR